MFQVDLNKLEEDVNNNEVKNPRQYLGRVKEDTALKIVKVFSQRTGIDLETAYVLVAALCQLGATNKGGINQIEYTWNEKTATANDLVEATKTVDRKITVRQLARTYGTRIQMIAFRLGIPEDLAKRRGLEVDNQNEEEASWCSNFQTGNPDCPKEIRDWLMQNYKSRFQD